MPDVVVDRLRVHASPAGGAAPDPRASARALDLALPFPGRQVLIVRRLTVAGGDRPAARALLETMQRHAARPGEGPVDPHAEAVIFADEAEALLCLTRDVVNGSAGHWYWAGRLPAHLAHSSTPGEVLSRLWTAQPRWVPAVLTRLAADEPDLAARALHALSPGASELIAWTVAREYGVPSPQPSAFSSHRRRALPGSSTPAASQASLSLPDGQPTTEGLRDGAPSPGARGLSAPADRSGAEGSAEPLPAATRQLLELAFVIAAGPVPSLLVVPARAETNSLAAVKITASDSPSVPAQEQRATVQSPTSSRRSGTAAVPSAAAMVTTASPVNRPADSVAVGRPQPGVNLMTKLSDGGIPAWSGAASTTASAIASATYAIALMLRTGAFRVAEARGETGWAAVGGTVRWLLSGLPRRRCQVALRDPLLLVLSALDGRPRAVPQPALPDLATRRRMQALLSAQRVPRAAFARAGTVHVSRTHVDVVFPINAIDLCVRAAGLDQDPGWVPALGRVVLVHFEGGG